jgi:methionyl-tRNA formyltransferase
VHELAERAGLDVRTPKSLKKGDAQAAFAALDLDVAVVVAYGLILPKPVLEAPRRGCVNLHGSLLPRWRGAAPIQRAVMAGDARTGVQAMLMDEGLDTGAVLATAETPIEADDTASSVHDRLAALGAPLLLQAVEDWAAARIMPVPQAADGVTYAEKITPAETRIDWSLPARSLDCRIRGLSLFPGAWFELPTPKGPVRMKALMSRLALNEAQAPPGTVLDDGLRVACGEGAVRLLAVQREGKGPMAADAFLRGQPIEPGTVLG